MQTLIEWQDARHAVLAIAGPVDAADVDRLREMVGRLRSIAALELDLHEAAIADVALVSLAAGLEEPGRPCRCTMRGLSEHHHRLLRYFGMPARPRS